MRVLRKRHLVGVAVVDSSLILRNGRLPVFTGFCSTPIYDNLFYILVEFRSHLSLFMLRHL
jgi:hypothetical protein